MKSLPIAEGGDTVSTLSLSEDEHGRAVKMTADVLDIIIGFPTINAKRARARPWFFQSGSESS
jgi:hypothetical protein